MNSHKTTEGLSAVLQLSPLMAMKHPHGEERSKKVSASEKVLHGYSKRYAALFSSADKGAQLC